MGYEKGANSREQLIEQSKAIFNEEGLNVTLNYIASNLGISLGKLTYHFATKDKLFVAIAEEYEKRIVEMRSTNSQRTLTLSLFYQIMSSVMDLQYEYRCVMQYFASSSKKQLDLMLHTSKSFDTRKESLFNILYACVSSGELKIEILKEEKFNALLFLYTSLFTFWPIHLEIYDRSDNYVDKKPFYLKGIFSIFVPFLTAKGEDSMRNLGLID